MSLDVYLTSVDPIKSECHHCGSSYETYPENFEANITHNLGTMASEAGIYDALWRPENISAIYAKDIIEPLTRGLALLKEKPDYFRQFNASNGWGVYENLLEFTEKYLDACQTFPDNKINVSR